MARGSGVAGRATRLRQTHGRPWDPARFLARPDFGLPVAEVCAAIEYQEKARIEDHPFFARASSNRLALRLWAEQELVTSSLFSQALSMWVSNIDNCNVRSAIIPVLAGEHHEVVDGLAYACHPNLAKRLCESLGSRLAQIVPCEATIEFVEAMEAAASSPLGGAGFLGIGNERMLIPEYTAVRSAFMLGWPEAEFGPFLDANIGDDRVHSALVEQAAAALISLGDDPVEFLTMAIAGVDARIRYYDRLCELLDDPVALREAVAG